MGTSESNGAFDLIKDAVETIGANEGDDYRVQPGDFPNRVPQLGDLLTNASLTETASQFQRQDQEAIRCQQSYKRLARAGAWLVFAATTCTALLASLTSVQTCDGWCQALRIVLAGISACSGALAAGILYSVTNRRMLYRWMRSRAEAETERLGYFDELIRLVLKNSPEDKRRQLLVLELFRRYQLDVEESFYRRRAKDHQQSRGRTVALGAVSAILIAGVGGGLGLWAAVTSSGWLSLSALGTIGAGLSVLAGRREELNQDERNLERYERTHDALIRVRKLHTDVQTAILAGHSDILARFVAATHELLSAEHRQWAEDTSKMNSALRNLTEALDKHPSGDR